VPKRELGSLKLIEASEEIAFITRNAEIFKSEEYKLRRPD